MDGASDLVDDRDDQPFGAPIPRAFRLADAERIAANRLDGAAEGSLKEALATKIVEPAPEGQSLAARLDQVAAHQGDEGAPLRVFQAAPEATFGWMNAVPPAHAVPFFDAPEAPADAVQQAAELMPDACLDTSWVKEWSALRGEQEVHVETVAPLDASMSEAVEDPAGPFPATPDHQVAVADAVAGDGIDVVVAATDVEPVVDVGPNPVTEPTSLRFDHAVPVADVETDGVRDGGEPPALVPANDRKLEPIVTAFAASARLAADATAASQALHHLKKLLSEQLSEPVPGAEAARDGSVEAFALPAPEQPAMPAGEPPARVMEARQSLLASGAIQTDIPEVAAAVPVAHARQAATPNLPPPLPRMAPAPPEPAGMDPRPALPQDVPLEALPKCVVGKPAAPLADRHRPQTASNPNPSQPRAAARSETAAAPPPTVKDVVRTQRQMMQKSQPAKPQKPPKPQRRPRRAFDFRGFAAGFALSGAIGLLLYFVMSTS